LHYQSERVLTPFLVCSRHIGSVEEIMIADYRGSVGNAGLYHLSRYPVAAGSNEAVTSPTTSSLVVGASTSSPVLASSLTKSSWKIGMHRSHAVTFTHFVVIW
jgi:hypothetical protein